MSVLALLGAEVKAQLSVQRLPFMRTSGGSGSSGYLPYMENGLRHISSIGQAGAAMDYDKLVGDPLTNSVVARCVEMLANGLPDAPPYLEQRKGSTWERVDEHEVLDLLRYPNPYHSDAEIWQSIIQGERIHGNGYWYLAWDGTKPREIWPLRANQVEPQSTEEEFISGYWVTAEGGQRLSKREEDVIHFRHMLSPWNPRTGWSPIETGKRQIAGDNAAASYHSSILRNSGVLSLLIAIKEGKEGNASPEQIEGFVKALQRKLFGEGAGGIAGLNLPLDVHRLAYSPDEMALNTLISYYETRICVLMGVDPMVAGVGSGTQQKTYANFGEALQDFWERTIVPMHNRHAAVLTAQLLPLFGLEPREWRLRFDYSNVAALQENKDALHTRLREDFKAGGIDLFTYQTERGMNDVPEEYKGQFYKPPSAPKAETEDMENQPNEREVKAIEQAETIGELFDRLVDELTDPLKAQQVTQEALAAASAEQRALLEARQEG